MSITTKPPHRQQLSGAFPAPVSFYNRHSMGCYGKNRWLQREKWHAVSKVTPVWTCDYECC